MGEVYQAHDTKLDRDVALKVLPEAFTSDPDRLARFEREAKVLASLNHPNIGSIYGLEEAEGVKALVLELIEGPTLADRIKQGPIPIDEALPIAKQIAEALEAAHEAGVIHRDLKAANIKVQGRRHREGVMAMNLSQTVYRLGVLPVMLLVVFGCSDRPVTNSSPGSTPTNSAQDTTDVGQESVGAASSPGLNPLRNAYFGDLHVHTRYSFDAYVFQVRGSPDDAYRYAKGEPITHPSGHILQLKSGPLDFQAVTDHGLYLGAMRAMDLEHSGRQGRPLGVAFGVSTEPPAATAFLPSGINRLGNLTPGRRPRPATL